MIRKLTESSSHKQQRQTYRQGTSGDATPYSPSPTADPATCAASEFTAPYGLGFRDARRIIESSPSTFAAAQMMACTAMNTSNRCTRVADKRAGGTCGVFVVSTTVEPNVLDRRTKSSSTRARRSKGRDFHANPSCRWTWSLAMLNRGGYDE